MTLETLITFLTIENNNMNNYIVTFEYRVMVTAFAILAMFETNCGNCAKYHVCEDEDGIWYSDVIFFSSYTGITIKAF